MNWIWVFIGGGLGAMARYSLARLIPWNGRDFPWATLSANVLSCLVIGLFIGFFLQKGDANSRFELMVLVGFCGGFSTFSSFAAENLKLIQNDNIWLAGMYMGSSIAVCIVAIIVGIKLFS